MSRRNRDHLPGAAFHIVARTQNKEPLFERSMRADIMRIMIEGVLSSDACLLAVAVMPNHFHIVLQQGMRTLGWIMQPIMRRIALRVLRTARIDGHVFARKYRTAHCDTHLYVRRTIAYVNLNAWRAELCDDPCHYAWTWHHELAFGRDPRVAPHVERALRLFAKVDAPTQALRQDYLEYIRWRMKRDRRDALEKMVIFDEPDAPAGAKFFSETFDGLPVPTRRARPDLRDRAAAILKQIEPCWELDRIRTKYGCRYTTTVRNQAIADLLQHEYRVKSIADFFRVSDSTVSAIGSAMRAAALAALENSGRGSGQDFDPSAY